MERRGTWEVKMGPHHHRKSCGVICLVFWIYLMSTLALMLEVEGKLSGINSLAFDSKLQETMDEALGFSQIQAKIDKAKFKVDVPHGLKLVDKLVRDVEERIRIHNDALKKLRNVLQKNVDIDRSGDPLVRCCDIDDSTVNFDSNFRVKVNAQAVCSRENGRYTMHGGEAFLATARNNSVNIPNLGWQYFGSEEGMLVSYPARQDESCEGYDPRNRPFYAEASAPLPKDIVIILNYKNVSNLDLTSDAIKVLISTTNANDRIGIIDITHLNRVSSGDSGCYYNSLAFATPLNTLAFEGFLDDIKTNNRKSSGDFLAGFQRAFRYFNKDSDTTRGRLILLITDSNHAGSSTNDPLVNYVAEENAKMDNSVVIETFSVGDDISPENIDLLRRLAETTAFITSTGTRKPGVYTPFNQSASIRQQLGTYYDAFADPGSVQKPLVTVPYVDFSGIGLVISICLPVHNTKDTFVGVVCIDVKMKDIFLNISYYTGSRNAYAFLIDVNGRTIIHPLLPRPQKVQDNPIFMDISTLERDPHVANIVESMKRGENGSETRYVYKLDYPFLGSSDSEQYERIMAHYFWRKIPESRYSICLVLTNVDADVSLLEIDKYITNTKYEDQLQKTCTQHGIAANKDRSLVSIHESAYDQLPSVHARQPGQVLYQYFNQDNSRNLQDVHVKRDIYNWTALTGEVNDIWRNDGAMIKYNQLIYWRYIATLSGVIRIYPGAEFSLNPSKEYWYRLALRDMEHFILTPQVSDNMDYSIVIARALRVGRNTVDGLSLQREIPVAVMAADFRPGYFYHIMQTLFPACREKANDCFLVDSSGYVLAHRNTLRSRAKQHLIDVEPHVALYLVQKNLMNGSSCFDFEAFTEQLNYRIQLHTWILESTRPPFELHTVHPNLYIGIVKNRTLHNSKVPAGSWKCMREENCECPRTSKLHFSYCENKLSTKYSKPVSNCPILSDKHPVNAMNEGIPRSYDNPCFPTSCEANSLSECLQIIGCDWCYPHDDSRNVGCMVTSRCSNITIAPVPSSATSTAAIVVPVILILLLVAAVIILILLYKCKPEVFTCCLSVFGKCRKQDQSGNQGMVKTTAVYNEKGGDIDGGNTRVATDSVSTLPRPPVPPPDESVAGSSHSQHTDDSIYSHIYDQSRSIPSRPSTFHSGVSNGPHGSGSSWPVKSATMPESQYLHARALNSRSASESDAQLSSSRPSFDSYMSDGQPAYSDMHGGPPSNEYVPESRLPQPLPRGPLPPPNATTAIRTELPQIPRNPQPPSARWSAGPAPKIPQYNTSNSLPRGQLPQLSEHPQGSYEPIEEKPHLHIQNRYALQRQPSTQGEYIDELAPYQNSPKQMKDYSHYSLGYNEPPPPSSPGTYGPGLPIIPNAHENRGYEGDPYDGTRAGQYQDNNLDDTQYDLSLEQYEQPQLDQHLATERHRGGFNQIADSEI